MQDEASNRKVQDRRSSPKRVFEETRELRFPFRFPSVGRQSKKEKADDDLPIINIGPASSYVNSSTYRGQEFSF